MRLIKFERSSCVGCVMVQGYLDSQGVEVEKINVEENRELAEDFGISSVPVTILLDEKGGEVKRTIGFKPNELEEMVGLIK